MIHTNTIIGNNVRIYQNVTIGRGDVYRNPDESLFEGIEILEGAILCAGSKILCTRGVLTIGCNSIVAANSVVTSSIPDNEIWGGIPARKISVLRNKKI